MSLSILLYLLIILVFAFVGGVILKSLKQPPVVGYLLAGLVLGIISGQFAQVQTVEFLSELGVVLLLFTLGLEFSWTRLQQVAKVAVWGALLQIFLTVILGTLFMTQFGFSWFSSLFMAAAFSLSSTAVVVKILSDRGEIDTLPGEILVAWLIIQDVVALPLIILLPTMGKTLLGNDGFGIEGIVLVAKNLSLAFLILGGVFILGKKVVPWIIGKVAAVNSRELLLVSVFVVVVSSALFTQDLGLSAALGAFLAGLLIAESSQQHAVFSEIRPLRDLFALIFFTTLGLILPPGFLFSHLGQIMGVTVGIIILKFIIVGILTLYFGYHAKTSFIVSVGLVEVGEFAFILARVGLSEKVITTEVYGLILSVALVSIMLMPPLFLAAPALYRRLKNFSKAQLPPLYTRFFTRFEHRDTLEELPFKDHVVLCGYGRVGKYIGRALTMAEIPFVVIEYNHHKANALKKAGIPVVYGDPSDIDILDYAQVDKARAVVVAIPDLHTQQMVVTNSLLLNKKIEIYCRTHHEEHQNVLKTLGATAIIQPEFEASLSITNKILKSFGQEDKEIEGKISRLKIEHGLG